MNSLSSEILSLACYDVVQAIIYREMHIGEERSGGSLELSPELDASFELGDDSDTDFYEEPPCLCAQQIISTLFGTILGYSALLLSPAQIYFPLAFAQVRMKALCSFIIM